MVKSRVAGTKKKLSNSNTFNRKRKGMDGGNTKKNKLCNFVVMLPCDFFG